MSRSSRLAVLWAAATLLVVALADGVTARGGGRGGGGRGAGGFSRGGGGFSRGGPAASGSFGQNRPAGGMDRGYNVRGPAADGSFGTQLPNRGERLEQRQERREERQEQREERREDWPEYAEDHCDDGYCGGYYGGYYGYYEEAGVPVYWTLPCTPTVMSLGGTIYYVCGSDWYIRAYSDGSLVYMMVPPPTGQQ